MPANKKLKSVIITAAVTAVITLIIYMALSIHEKNEAEIRTLFRFQQRNISSWASKKVENKLKEISNYLSFCSSALKYETFRQYLIKIDSTVESANLYSSEGVVKESTSDTLIGKVFSDSELFKWIKSHNDIRFFKTSSASLITIAAPLYNDLPRSKKEFTGAVSFNIDLEKLFSSELSFNNLGNVLQEAWVMESDGTLIYNPGHKDMISKNIFRVYRSCSQCHSSFDIYKPILKNHYGLLDYETVDGVPTLASFSTVNFKNISWKIIANISYQQLSNSITYNFHQTLLLLLLVSMIIISASIMMYRQHYLRTHAEEENRQLREKEIILNEWKESQKHVREQNKRIEEMNKDLRALIIGKDKFFSIIAHDLRSPFQGLISFSEMLHEDYNDLTEEEKRRYIYNMKESIQSTYKLVENLLEWSRIQIGNMDYNPEIINLDLHLQPSLQLLTQIAINKNIKIDSYIGNEYMVEVDKNMLSTIIRNLVSNSIKFTNMGGMISISANKVDQFVEISVKDNGVGIKEEKMKCLFVLDKNLSTRGTLGEQGTGLGLILCKEMIEKNKGTISVESIENEGTTIRFTIPLFNCGNPQSRLILEREICS